MVNLVDSIGYSLGRVHVGLIAYLCDLYRDGTREPFESFLTELNVPVPQSPDAKREWKSVDLAIFDDQAESPRILIEMKVDDHEHYRKRKRGKGVPEWQTSVYARETPGCDAYLFITLGMGEFYAGPADTRFRWVRLREFLKAAEAIKRSDLFIEHWREALRNEVKRQDQAAGLTPSRRERCLEGYRAGSWNVYLLGFLKEALFELLPRNCEMKCYPYGTRPDTILNFGSAKHPAYVEINYNGRLHLKMSLKHLQTEFEKQREVHAAMQTIAQLFPDVKPHAVGKLGKSKTIVSFNVGLEPRDGCLKYQSSQADTCEKIAGILRVFFGEWPEPAV